MEKVPVGPLASRVGSDSAAEAPAFAGVGARPSKATRQPAPGRARGEHRRTGITRVAALDGAAYSDPGGCPSPEQSQSSPS